MFLKRLKIIVLYFVIPIGIFVGYGAYQGGETVAYVLLIVLGIIAAWTVFCGLTRDLSRREVEAIRARQRYEDRILHQREREEDRVLRRQEREEDARTRRQQHQSF